MTPTPHPQAPTCPRCQTALALAVVQTQPMGTCYLCPKCHYQCPVDLRTERRATRPV